MSLTFYAFLLVASLALVSSQSSPLCTPDQWEGYEGSLGGYVTDENKRGTIKEFLSIHYDAINERSAVFLDYVNGEYENKFQMVVHYKAGEGKIYVVNEKEQSCWQMKLKRPFRKACIPESAKKLHEYYLGLSGGLKATAYEVKCHDVVNIFSVEMKGDAFIPLTETVMGRLGKADFMQGVGFYDLTPGIKNETVFVVPELCEERFDVTMVEELVRQHYILAL